MTTQPAVRLSAGAHEPDGEFCLMEHISVRAGLPWSDNPRCTHPVLAAMGRRVNDRLDDEARQQLLTLEDDIMSCPPRPDLERGLSVQLAIWCAEQVLPVYEAKHPDDNRPRKAIDAARAWVTTAASDAADAAYAASYAAYAASYAADAAYAASAADAASAAAYAASDAAASDAAYAASDASDAAYAAAYAASAAAYAAYAASAAYAAPQLIELLQGLIKRYRELAAEAATRSEPAGTTTA